MSIPDSQQKGIVFNIQNYSVHDGTGIRTLVFLKGCPLRCRWCSNPESQNMRPDLAFNPRKCLTTEKCTRCIKACPNGALSASEQNMPQIDPEKCVRCHTCAEACPANALNVYGETMTVAEVIKQVEKDSPFYTRSGGGMTLSGGEAMAQGKFAAALLREGRKHRIHCMMETCGHCSWETLKEACQSLDALIMDIKCMDSAKHKQFTGVGNERILENFGKVCEEFPDLPIMVRTPVVPGFNDTEEDIRAILEFLPLGRKGLSYEMLPYHRFGEPKYNYLGRTYEMTEKELDEGLMARLQILQAGFAGKFAQ
ncbi:MAG: (2S)-3-sulfopropanediol dehydratase activating enzyme [Desulfovibrio sp.]|uniref:(2S)-3-sulfopropanediol dehydratase activating enzyme n=1 Tax=Desulfovibrio sp. 7SRBS1 TaxID=3378064 RepID=UPI003B3F0D2A